MPLSVKVSGSWKTATPSVRVSGAWKAVAAGFVRVAGAWKEFYSATPPPSTLAVTVDTTAVAGGGEGNGPFETGRVERSISGGVAPYTTLWERVSGAPYPDIAPNDGNIQNPYFIGTGTAPEVRVAVWRCKVTDNVGAIAYSPDVTVTFTFTATPPPALSVTVNRTYLDGMFVAPPASGNATTIQTVTATPVGGVGPFAYLWERISGDSATSANYGTAATTDFTRFGSPFGNYDSAWRCKVTDTATAAVAYSEAVSVNLIFEA